MHKNEYLVRKFSESLKIRIKMESRKGMYEKKPVYIFAAVCVTGLIASAMLMIIMDTDISSLIPKLAVFAVVAFRVIPATGRLSTASNGIAFNRQNLKNAYNNLKEVDSVENMKYGISEENKRVEIFEFKKEISLDSITWKYPQGEKDILKNCSLKIKKGQSIALIGPSGAGKTTLVDIILGLIEPLEGNVLVDGKSIFHDLKNWFQHIGYVPQPIYLLDDTIRSNIAFGVEPEKIDDEKVWKAIEQAQIKEFIVHLEQGIHTVVGERGVRFSGGQRQRIAIARALYSNPDILILDEATSALDNDTELAVMDAIEHLKGIKTLIIIAHRLSTIEHCDRVYEIKEGSVN